MLEDDGFLPLDRLTIGKIKEFPPGSFCVPLSLTEDDTPCFVVANADGEMRRVRRLGRVYSYSEIPEALLGIGLQDYQLEITRGDARGFEKYADLRTGALAIVGDDVQLMATTANGVVQPLPFLIKLGGVKNAGGSKVAFGKWRAIATFGDKDVVLWEHPSPS